MAQHDYVIANGTGAAVRSDLNAGFAAIVSQNSGATAPSTTYAYQSWADTSAGVMKMRNGANNAWITLYQLDGEWSTIAFENGTAAAPSIYFKDSGTDTGIYSPGADQVGISTGGTVRLTTTTTGITSALPVDVPLGAVGTPSITFTGDLNTGIYSPGADQVGISTGGTSRFQVSTTAATSTLPVVHPLGAVGTPSITFTGDLNTGIWSPAADTIAFSEGGAEAMRIDSNSRLLVGTSSARSNFFGTTLSAVTQTEGTGGAAGRGALSVINNDVSNNPPYLLLGRSGAASLGSNAAVVSGSRLGTLTFQGADGTNFIEAATVAGEVDGTPGTNDMPGRLVFSTTADGAASPTERMRITNAGEVLVGTTTPVLNAAGLSTSVAAAFASGLRLQDGGGVGWAGNPTIRNNNGSGYLICMNGTTGGVGLLNGGTSWTSLSDENYKTDLVPIANAASKVRSLRTVTGRYTDDDESTSRSFLIAQDVEAVLPEAVSTADNGKKLLSYTDTIPLLTAALKEALEKIESLEARLTAAGI